MPASTEASSGTEHLSDETSAPLGDEAVSNNGKPNGEVNMDKAGNAVNLQDGEEETMTQSLELTPPPLPPRPPLTQAGSLRLSSRSSRPQLLSTPTTALSLGDVHTQTSNDPNHLQSPSVRPISRKASYTHFGRFVGNNNSSSDGDDSASLQSFVPTLDTHMDNESIMGDVAGNASWRAMNAEVIEQDDLFEFSSPEDDILSDQIQHEFDELDSVNSDGSNEEALLVEWKAKLKHFFILSASGKPVYSRHGDDQLISHYIGVAQTLISFHQGSKDQLKGFTAGGTRFVILPKGPLNLVAISRLPESDAQLRTQLESLYMQILSTLTLPSMERMFSNRPSTDLRRPLQGTEVLLDGLADGFTRGSPSTLLSALECLRLRKTHRRVINETLLKVRSPNLLYGLIVGAGRLVSVVRPKKHSLHPGDLHLIFNMLFEAGSVKAGGGENWIPVCLPGFNNTGFLYMYVSFFTAAENVAITSEERTASIGSDDELAIVLISAKQDAFFEMRTMRDDLVAQLESNGSIAIIGTAIRKGHAPCSDIVPGTVLRHFLYKSRGNVQFVMPSFPSGQTGGQSSEVTRRRLMSLYHQLHESIHSRTAHLKVQHSIASDATAVAWETQLFELYCIAGPQASRAALAHGANRVAQWVRREEERVFIIGGAVW